MKHKFDLKLYNLLQINLWIKWREQKSFTVWMKKYSEVFSKIWEKYSGDIDKVRKTMDSIENKLY